MAKELFGSNSGAALSKKNDAKPAFQLVEDVVGCKWTLQVLETLRQGYLRPGEIKKAVSGISAKVLNERLKKLTRYNLIDRKIYPEVPPRVEYAFTKKGRTFLRVLDAIYRLSREQM